MNIGHVLTIFALLISFWAAHWSNVKRIKQDAGDLREMKTKLDMIYQWFCGNVVGRGEPQRHRHQEGD